MNIKIAKNLNKNKMKIKKLIKTQKTKNLMKISKKKKQIETKMSQRTKKIILTWIY